MTKFTKWLNVRIKLQKAVISLKKHELHDSKLKLGRLFYIKVSLKGTFRKVSMAFLI